ncbi:MAG: ATP-binding protein [Nitrososphaeraceae archaeon]
MKPRKKSTDTNNNLKNNKEITEILYGTEDSVRRGVDFMQNAKVFMDLFGEKNGPSIIMTYDVYKNNYNAARQRGCKIRLITEITKDNLQYCKELLNVVSEMKHLEGFVGGIAVSESEYMTTTTLKEKQLLTQVFYSNAREVVEQARYTFRTFWSKAIPADQRIREIEHDIQREFIETISDPNEILELATRLVKSAKDEILVIFSSANAFARFRKSGRMNLLVQSAISYRVIVKILTPLNDTIVNDVEIMQRKYKNIEIRGIEPALQTRVTILIVDKSYSFVTELNDDTKPDSEDAVGLCSYSNSKSTVLSYVSIFETLWRQSELYKQLQGLYQELAMRDNAQREFIDIAAHELRTPIQPILGLSEVAMARNKDDNLKEILEIIAKNAKRLYRLTERVLDVTRIDSKILKLNDDAIDILSIMETIVSDYTNEMRNSRRDIELIWNKDKLISVVRAISDNCVELRGDQSRLVQVISNLISNAIKFTEDRGTITIDAEVDFESRIFTIKIIDNGRGIDPDICPKLFSKFSTKSDHGTGLGLYLCKNLVEAHGGSIWGDNNKQGKGATFSFSLPLYRNNRPNSEKLVNA